MRPKETISPDSPLNPARLPPHLKWIGQALEEILGIGYPLAIAGFFLVANITTWRDRTRALRVLLLRPFGEEKMTSAIKQVVLKHLGPQGLVFTLEDRNYKPHWIIAIIGGALGAYYYVIGPLIRPALRIATVKSERRYAKLALSLTDLWMPSFRSFVNGGQAFNIRCTNDWWQTTIDLLMNSSEIIVMDVSRVSKGSAWEIDRLEARGLLPKCIFIVQSGHEGDGMEGVTRLLPAALVPTLFTYEESGEFVDRAAFANAVKAHMQSALATWGRPTQDGIRQDVAVQPSLS